MKRIFSILACVAITMVVISGCGTKGLNPYSEKKVVEYAKEVFRQDIEIIESKYVKRKPDYIEYHVKFKDAPEFTFKIDSYVKPAMLDGSAAIPGTYRRYLSTTYFDELVEFKRKKIEKVITDNMFKPETVLSSEYQFTINSYSDIERIAKTIIEMDKVLDIQADNSVKGNPLTSAEDVPPVVVYCKSQSNAFVDDFKYSTYDKKLVYDDIVRSMQVNYVNLVKHGEVNDPTVDKSILNKIPTKIITDLYVNMKYYGENDRVEFVYIPEKDDYVFTADFRVREDDRNKSIFENIIKTGFGGKYDVQTLKDYEDRVSWTIGNDNYVANIKYKYNYSEVSAIDV